MSQRILVTGANRGLGFTFVTRYLERGDSVIAVCRAPQQAEGLHRLAQQYPDRLQILQADVADPGDLARLGSALANQAVDVMICNAGVYGPRAAGFGAVESEPWHQVLTVNTIAPLLLTQELMPALRRGQGRTLVYITSKMGSIAENNSGGSYIYRSSKAALNAVVRSLAMDLSPEGFTAVVLHPGWVLTDMGGPNALITADTSVAGMMAVVDGLDPAATGRFFNYDGTEIAW